MFYSERGSLFRIFWDVLVKEGGAYRVEKSMKQESLSQKNKLDVIMSKITINPTSTIFFKISMCVLFLWKNQFNYNF